MARKAKCARAHLHKKQGTGCVSGSCVCQGDCSASLGQHATRGFPSYCSNVGVLLKKRATRRGGDAVEDAGLLLWYKGRELHQMQRSSPAAEQRRRLCKGNDAVTSMLCVRTGSTSCHFALLRLTSRAVEKWEKGPRCLLVGKRELYFKWSSLLWFKVLSNLRIWQRLQ